MAFTFDPATDRGKVRLLINDTDTATVANQIFDDASIDAFLALSDDEEVKLAAALALDTIASNQAYLQKKVKLGDIATDGPAVAAALRQHAATLRAEVEGATSNAFEVVEVMVL